MKHFLIKYRHKSGSQDDWHKAIGGFIAALNSDPAVQGKIGYRCLKNRDGTDYYHLASAADDDASKALGNQAFFKRYQEQTKLAAGGEVEVVPLELIAETDFRG